MVARAKKPKINWDCLGSKKQAIKKDKKIFQERKEEEKEVLVCIYFIKEQFRC